MVCIEPYAGNSVGHIRLQPGDVIEVVGSTDCGLLEGYVRGSNQSGFFPAEYVQEVNLRQKNITSVSTANSGVGSTQSTISSYLPHNSSTLSSAIHHGSPQLSIGGNSIIGGGTLPRQNLSRHHSKQQHHQIPHQASPSLSLNSDGSNTNINGLGNYGAGGAPVNPSAGQYSSATAPRIKKT